MECVHLDPVRLRLIVGMVIQKNNLLCPNPTSKKIKSFATPTKLAAWLRKNHDKQDELWVKVLKKHTGRPSVTWNEIVIETLCWGWIDGVKKSLDYDPFLSREKTFT